MEDTLQENMKDSNAFVQGKVISKLESIEHSIQSLQADLSAQRNAIELKTDKDMFEAYAAQDRKDFDSVHEAFDSLSSKVMVIMGGVAVLSFVGQIILTHYWK